MTEHTDKVNKRREEIKKEKEDNSVTFIDVRFKNGKWYKRTVGYGNGKEITEYSDKRKKDKIEWQ